MKPLFFIALFCFSVFAYGQQQDRTNKDRALFFAVNAYENMTPLQNPVKDAQRIAAELEKRYGFQTEVVSNPYRSPNSGGSEGRKSMAAKLAQPAKSKLLLWKTDGDS